MIRVSGPEDAGVTWEIYRDAIRNGTSGDYSTSEAAAWAGPPERPEWWDSRLADARSWLHEGKTGPDGFISLAPPAHLDFFFLRPTAQGSGIAPALYDVFASEAKEANRGHMTAFASRSLRPFLMRRGWVVTERQTAERNGVLLERFAMEFRPEAQSAGNQSS